MMSPHDFVRELLNEALQLLLLAASDGSDIEETSFRVYLLYTLYFTQYVDSTSQARVPIRISPKSVLRLMQLQSKFLVNETQIPKGNHVN
jgi:hypothetical protein